MVIRLLRQNLECQLSSKVVVRKIHLGITVTSKILMLWSVFILNNCLLSARLGLSGWTKVYSHKWLAEVAVPKDASPTLFIIISNITHVVLHIIFIPYVRAKLQVKPWPWPISIHRHTSNQVNERSGKTRIQRANKGLV